MSSNISHLRTLGPIPGRSSLRAKLYPNGEVAIWKAKTYTPRPVSEYDKTDRGFALIDLWSACGNPLGWILNPGERLGLSPLRNSDKAESLDDDEVADAARRVKAYGRHGITRFGARRVRCAAHILEKALPKMCTVFATVTVPSLPVEHLAVLHENWNKVVETYRRKLTRWLKNDGLSGESVTVSEVQSKRYERTGLPVLHLHTVFGGRKPSGRPSLTVEAHDQMWAETLSVVIGEPVTQVGSACNLQWIRKSAEGYIGKYMTKGTKAVSHLCDSGFGGWIPKQWWSISRGLSLRIDNETRDVSELAEWLSSIADEEGSDCWLWHRDIQIEMASGDKITVARYGKLSKRQTAEVQMYYSSA